MEAWLYSAAQIEVVFFCLLLFSNSFLISLFIHISAPPREGANIHGLYMEGARWDTMTGGIVESRMMDLFPMMPVIYIKAVTQDKQDTRNVYECPVYKIR